MNEKRLRLEGKVGIVVGAGSIAGGVGTGKAMSILFAREGCRVLLVDNEAARAEDTLIAIREGGGEASVLEADLTKEDDCRKMAEAAVDRYGRLDILVNNVGIGSAGNVLEVDVEGWHRTLDTNLLGQVLTSRYAIPRMIESGGGSIINIASFLGMRVGGSGSVAYNVSKGGVMTLTIKMAVDHGRDNIRVNCIAPGQLYNPRMVEKMSDERRELRRLSAPLGTEGTPWDIAWAALFLASDEARWITGVILPVDAGLVATTPLAMHEHLR